MMLHAIKNAMTNQRWKTQQFSTSTWRK